MASSQTNLAARLAAALAMAVSRAGEVAGDEHVVGLDAHVVEGELGLRATSQPHLLVHAGDADAGGGEVDDDGANALGPFAARKARPDQAGGRLVAAGDVVLVGVEA